MNDTDRLINHMKRFVPIQLSDTTALQKYLHSVKASKKENLVEALQPCKYHYFVVEGCLRLYFFNEKGDEQTIQFALEDWWITDHAAFSKGVNTLFYIQAIEPSTLLAIDHPAQEELFREVPLAERYFRLIYERAYAASQYRMRIRHDYSGEQNYLTFKKSFPAFADRVPQYMLASYLGITPEYLSVIKKRHA